MNRQFGAKWLLILIGILLLVAFFTNPSQSLHLKAIRETGALRNSQPDASLEDWLLLNVEYRNYGIFSTTNC
jgi:hypothetical protein